MTGIQIRCNIAPNNRLPVTEIAVNPVTAIRERVSQLVVEAVYDLAIIGLSVRGQVCTWTSFHVREHSGQMDHRNYPRLSQRGCPGFPPIAWAKWNFR